MTEFNFFFVSLQWSVESEAPKYKAQPPLSFGLLLRPELAASVLERGPPADSPKVMSPVSLLFAHMCVLCSFIVFPIEVQKQCFLGKYNICFNIKCKLKCTCHGAFVLVNNYKCNIFVFSNLAVCSIYGHISLSFLIWLALALKSFSSIKRDKPVARKEILNFLSF